GPRIPVSDVQAENARYCRLMLILFKPWRSIEDLRGAHGSWSAAFEEFITMSCSDRIRTLINNMRVLHECK
ncbi:hypothetical protein BC629DRAFT_1261312, partial [Irpex lacteus]